MASDEKGSIKGSIVIGGAVIGSVVKNHYQPRTGSDVFADVRAALDEIADSEARRALDRLTRAMEAERGSGEFLNRYKEFMQHAANHMSVLGPFIPALTQLLTK